jgi:hypothetical protein
VPFALGDLWITIADSIVIPAKVLYIHPTHNLAFLKYDTALVGETPVKSAPLAPVSEISQGSKVKFFAFNHNYQPICIDTFVTDIMTVTVPPTGSPRFRAINFGTVI